MQFIMEIIERLVSAAEATIKSHQRPTFTEHADALSLLIVTGKKSGVKRIQEGSFMGATLIISFEGDDTPPDVQSRRSVS